jgi:3-mercaptopyruvate sulfurtransferase SseA
MIFLPFSRKTIKYENKSVKIMSYAHPEVLVNTEWLSQNPPNEKRKLVEVDYDPVNGYQKGHINGASLIWWKRDINASNSFLPMISLVTGSLMSRFHQIRLAPLM